MHFAINQERVFAMLDVLVARWLAKQYPFNRPDAVIPQTIIPENLRADQFTLACWYFYACIYMRGGIESLQAFNALIRMWRDHPHLFDPGKAAFLNPEDIQPYLRKYIGWDSKAASINWVFNSRWLLQAWGGSPLKLIKGVQSYEEAERRIRNKRTKRDLQEAGDDGAGFRGFQPKMVSMLVYFYDWEERRSGSNQKWFGKPFIYPSPADFHNFRLGLATLGITVELTTLEDTARLIAEENGEEFVIHTSEKLSRPWREAVMAYIRARDADPLDVADSIWSFSLVMCGNSPATVTREIKPHTGLLEDIDVSEHWDHAEWVIARKRKQMEQTCFVCPFAKDCRYAIPARPYYRKGKLILRDHPLLKMDVPLGSYPDPTPQEVAVEEEVQHILHLHPSAA